MWRHVILGCMPSPPVERSDGFWIEAAEDRSLQRVVTSSEVRDRRGRLVIQAGWELADYRRNPVVLWAHETDRLPVGRADSIEVGEHGGHPALLSEIAFDQDQEFSRNVGLMMADGRLNAMSAGWIGLKSKAALGEEGEWLGMDYLASELVEQSVVPVPANPKALRAALELEIHREHLEVLFSDYRPGEPTHVDLAPATPKRPTAAFVARLEADKARARALQRTR